MRSPSFLLRSTRMCGPSAAFAHWYPHLVTPRLTRDPFRSPSTQVALPWTPATASSPAATLAAHHPGYAFDLSRHCALCLVLSLLLHHPIATAMTLSSPPTSSRLSRQAFATPRPRFKHRTPPRTRPRSRLSRHVTLGSPQRRRTGCRTLHAPGWLLRHQLAPGTLALSSSNQGLPWAASLHTHKQALDRSARTGPALPQLIATPSAHLTGGR